MTDYAELVKNLRHDGEKIAKLGSRFFSVKQGDMMLAAADAIEQLSTYSDFYEELTDRGIKGIRELLNKFPKWIPVTERLPKDMEKVLIFDDGKVKVGYIFDIWQGEEVHHEWYSEHYPADPSHWMPLPEPPKEETE